MSLSLIKLRFLALVLVAVCCVAASYGSQGSTNVITGTIEKVEFRCEDDCREDCRWHC